MWITLVTGEQKSLKRAEKELFMRLGITHIFTPSGLHLATLTVLFSRGWVFRFLSFTGAGVLGAIGLFPAMTRVLLLKGTATSFVPFCLVMLFEGIFFSWQRFDLSWICSWLFLGICYFSPQSHRSLWFSLGQMLLCHVFFQGWSFIGLITNLGMTLLMQVVFPVLLVISFLPKLPSLWAVELLDSLFEGFVFIDGTHRYLTPFVPHLGHLFFFLVWILAQGRERLFFLPLILLFLSTPLNQQKASPSSQSRWEIVEGKNVRCRFRWKNQRWEESCRSYTQERQLKARR